MSICTKLCPCHRVLGVCPGTGAWPVCAQAPRLWGPGSQRCERDKHRAGASEPSQPRFDAGRLTSSILSSAQASCGPSSGCATSTASSCPARPSVSSTMSSSSPWPTSSWRPSVSSTCPWAPSGPTDPLWTTPYRVWQFSLTSRRKRRRMPGCKQGRSTPCGRASWWTCISR
uniref:Uncharacterized protein n=1 Tax=Colobus angolensis palliatus TaxID=336983 RepID=A0A2K5K5Z4_COLAP